MKSRVARKPSIPRAEQPGYSLADALVLTGATLSNIQHWTKSDVIAADMANAAEGKGHHRRFSTFNLIELQLCATINRFHVPVEMMRGAANIFRAFHIGAVSFFEERNRLPFESSAVRVVTPGCDGSIMPGRLGLAGDARDRNLMARSFYENRDRFTGESPEHVAAVWNQLRTSDLIQGRPRSFPAGQFVGLFMAENAGVVSTKPDQLLAVLEGIAIAIDLVDVVWRVGEHHAKIGGANLAPW